MVGYGLLVPAFALVFGLLLYPILYEIQLSLTDAQTEQVKQILESRKAQMTAQFQALKSARHSVIGQAQSEPENELGKALFAVVGLAQADKFDKLVGEVLKRRSELAAILADRTALEVAMAADRLVSGRTRLPLTQLTDEPAHR